MGELLSDWTCRTDASPGLGNAFWKGCELSALGRFHFTRLIRWKNLEAPAHAVKHRKVVGERTDPAVVTGTTAPGHSPVSTSAEAVSLQSFEASLSI